MRAVAEGRLQAERESIEEKCVPPGKRETLLNRWNACGERDKVTSCLEKEKSPKKAQSRTSIFSLMI